MKLASPSHRPGSPVCGFFVAMQGGCVLILLGLWLCRAEVAWDRPAMIYAMCVWFTANFVWSSWSWYCVTGRMFDLYQLFLLAASLFNGGQFMLEVVGLNDRGLLEGTFSDELLLEVLLIVSGGMAALHLGALLAAARSVAGRTDAVVETADDPQLMANLRLVGGVLLAVSIPFVALGFKSAIGFVLSGGYMAIYHQEVQAGFSAAPKVLSAFVIPGAMFVLAGAGTSRRLAWFVLAAVACYAAVQFFIGQRHGGALALASLAWIWHRRVRPLNPAWLVGGAAVMGMIVFPLVRATRESSGPERISNERLIESFTSIDNPAISSIHEMGGSVNTLAHTMTLVPQTRNFDYGSSYFYALLTLFPNLIWDVHPSIAAGIPGEWLSWSIDPWGASRGMRLGYSFIAEAYLNFGAIGAQVFLFFCGWAYAAFVLWSDRPAYPARLALAASMAFFFLFVARAEAALVVRGVVWYAWLPYVTAVHVLPAWQNWKYRGIRLWGVKT